MSDAKFAKYEELAVGKFTKDGHTMFSQDVIYDLNRKSHLEQVTLEQQIEINELNNHRVGQNSCIKQQREEIDELTELLQLCVNDMYKPSGKISKKTAMKLMAACQKKIVEFPA